MRVILVISLFVLAVRASPIAKTPIINATQEVHGNDTHDCECGTKIEKKGRPALSTTPRIWPNNTVVYYIVESDFNSTQIDLMHMVMRAIEKVSCIKFKPRQSEDEYSVIIKTESKYRCYSDVGYKGKDRSKYSVDTCNREKDDNVEDKPSQILNLGIGCVLYGIFMHELLHAVGFHHTQSIYYRDDYIKIIWDKIIKGHEHNFEKYTKETMPDYGLPYDYGSIMHYAEKAFSTDGERTIIPLQRGVKTGQRVGMSKGDIAKLNIMYFCKEEKAVDQTQEKAVNQTQEKAVNQTQEKAVNQTQEKAVNQTQEKAVNQTQEKAVNQTQEKAVNQTQEKAVNQTQEKAVNQTQEKAVNQTQEKAVDQTQEKAVNQTQEKAVNQTQEKAVNQTQEKAVNQTQEKELTS